MVAGLAWLTEVLDQLLSPVFKQNVSKPEVLTSTVEELIWGSQEVHKKVCASLRLAGLRDRPQPGYDMALSQLCQPIKWRPTVSGSTH